MLGNRNELGSFLKGTKNQVGEDKHKAMPFAFLKRPFPLVLNMFITVILNSLCVSSSIWADTLFLALFLDRVLPFLASLCGHFV